MLWFIAPIALMVLGTVLALTYFSTASGLRRAFLRVPETIIRALREGVPARVTGTIAAYDISNVQAHMDPAAQAASAAMGADAYATGNQIAFGKAGASLHTAAHEAAHVVQQRAGVSLSGGVGKAGDTYEQHADRVADAVVAGKSAEPILAEMAGDSAPRAGGVQQKVVQRRIWVGGADVVDSSLITPPSGLSEDDLAALELGTYVKDRVTKAVELKPAFAGMIGHEPTWFEIWKAALEWLGVNPAMDRPNVEEQVRAKYVSWLEQRSAIENFYYAQPEGRQQSPERAAAEAQPAATTGATSASGEQAAEASVAEGEERRRADLQVAHTEQRVYPTVQELAVALIHESHPEYADKVAIETRLAQKVAADGQYGAAVWKIVNLMGSYFDDDDLILLEQLEKQSRYAAFSSLSKVSTLLRGGGGGDPGEAIILLDELNNYAPKGSMPAGFQALKVDLRKHPDFGDFRHNGWSVKESNEWVKAARELGVPLMAGPSGTTNGILALGASVGLGTKDIYRVAWAMHAFFNGMWRGQSGTHRLHEVMSVARLYCGADFTYVPNISEVG